MVSYFSWSVASTCLHFSVHTASKTKVGFNISDLDVDEGAGLLNNSLFIEIEGVAEPTLYVQLSVQGGNMANTCICSLVPRPIPSFHVESGRPGMRNLVTKRNGTGTRSRREGPEHTMGQKVTRLVSATACKQQKTQLHHYHTSEIRSFEVSELTFSVDRRYRECQYGLVYSTSIDLLFVRVMPRQLLIIMTRHT